MTTTHLISLGFWCDPILTKFPCAATLGYVLQELDKSEPEHAIIFPSDRFITMWRANKIPCPQGKDFTTYLKTHLFHRQEDDHFVSVDITADRSQKLVLWIRCLLP